MQKMAVIDLDDTLLSPDKTISPANLQALQALRESGFEIIIGSGRHLRGPLRQQTDPVSVEGRREGSPVEPAYRARLTARAHWSIAFDWVGSGLRDCRMHAERSTFFRKF